MAKIHRRAGSMIGPGLISVLSLAALIFFFHNQPLKSHSPSIAATAATSSSEPKDAAQNATLGFGAILVAIMPHRTDQMDIISMLSHFAGLDMTLVPGVDPQTIQDVALPPGGFRSNGGRPGHFGCWRSHMNMLKLVVDRKLSSALILEADVDWDVRLKEQFGNISANMKGRTNDFPYGTDWESMWVGHCRHISDQRAKDPIAVFPDETVPAMNVLKETVQAEFRHHGVDKDGHRMISKLFGPTCTAGYAVTLTGAMKLLYQLGTVGLVGTLDNEICRLVQSEPSAFGGIVVTPPLFAQYKTGTRKDSDIEEEVQELDDVNLRVCAHCVGRSVREELYDRIYPAGSH